MTAVASWGRESSRAISSIVVVELVGAAEHVTTSGSAVNWSASVVLVVRAQDVRAGVAGADPDHAGADLLVHARRALVSGRSQRVLGAAREQDHVAGVVRTAPPPATASHALPRRDGMEGRASARLACHAPVAPGVDPRAEHAAHTGDGEHVGHHVLSHTDIDRGTNNH